jgi:hypothetical protein
MASPVAGDPEIALRVLISERGEGEQSSTVLALHHGLALRFDALDRLAFPLGVFNLEPCEGFGG